MRDYGKATDFIAGTSWNVPCIFQGEGYSDLFVAHMGKILEQMQENPSLQIVTCADVICEKCPNLENGSCNTPDLVRAYDQKVLSFCGLEEGVVLTWDTFSKLVSEQILLPGEAKRNMRNMQME